MSLLTRRIDFEAAFGQFRDLRGRHPALWPLVPRLALFAGIVAATLVAAWAVYWRGQLDRLDAGHAREEQLRREYVDKVRQAVNFPALRKQKEQVTGYVNQLEKQLPNAAEMDALLADINHAGVGRTLEFQLFKPGQVVLRDYYAELPIKIELTGRFGDVAEFVSDVSNLARIVTLKDMDLELQEKTGLVKLDATARTYRYLDPEELAQVHSAAEKARKAAAKNRGAKGAAR